MSKFLELCNQLVSVESTCGERIAASSQKTDKYMYINGIFQKAKITHDEWTYGMAVVGNGITFEARLQQRTRVILALTFTLSDEKLSLYSSRIAEMVMMHIRGQTKGKSMECLALYTGFKPRSWHKRYKTVYDELCEWCNDLDSDASFKVGQVLKDENEEY